MERRKFIAWLSSIIGMGVVTGGATPFVKSLGPSADVELQRVVEVDISDIKPGQLKVAEWRGHPLFILRRTPEMIQMAQSGSTTIEPEDDSERVVDPEWLILDGTCQHLGCIPALDPDDGPRAWHCKCHGSEYDYSGRALRGPTPGNLKVPPVKFLDENTIRVGTPKKG